MPPKRTRGAGRRTQQPPAEEPAHNATSPATMPVQSGLAEANDAQRIRFLINTWGQDPLQWYPSSKHPFSDPNPTHWQANILDQLVVLANAAGPARRTEAVELMAEAITKRIDEELKRVKEWHKEKKLEADNGEERASKQSVEVAQDDKPAVRRSKRLNTAPQASTEPVAPKSKKKDKKKPDGEVPAAAEPLAVNTTTTADEDSKPPPPSPTNHPLPSDILAATTTLILRTDESTYPRASNPNYSYAAHLDPSTVFPTNQPAIPPTTSATPEHPVRTRPPKRLRSSLSATNEGALVPYDDEDFLHTFTEPYRNGDNNNNKNTNNSSSTDRDWRFPAPPPPRRIKDLKPGAQGTLPWAKSVETARQENAALVREAGGEQKLVWELETKGKLLNKLIEENRELRASAGPLKLEAYKLKKRVGELEGNERKREAEEELRGERRKRTRMEAEKAAASADVVVVLDDDDETNV